VHIPYPIPHHLLVDIIGIIIQDNPLIINLYFLIRFHIIIDNHLLGAGYQNLAQFHRRQPVDMDMRQKIVGVINGQIGYVFDARIKMTGSDGADKFRFASQHIIHNRNIVGRKIPNHIGSRPEKAQVYPDRIEIVNISQFTLVD